MTFELGPREKWLADQDYKRFKRSWYTRIAVGVITILLLLAVARMADACQILYGRKKDNQHELLAHEGGYHAGALYYRVIDDKRLIVNLVVVNTVFKRQGISTALFSSMLLAHPHATSVEALLVGDNWRATMLADMGHAASAEECENAVRRSPIYKSLAKLGFLKIAHCDHNPEVGTVDIRLER